MRPAAGSLAHMAGARTVKRIDVDANLLDQTRQAMHPAADAPDAEVVERALRLYVGRRAAETSQAMSELTEDQAIELANSELHQMRRSRRRAA